MMLNGFTHTRGKILDLQIAMDIYYKKKSSI